MASGVEELLDMLFEMVDEAKNMPLSSDRSGGVSRSSGYRDP